MCCDQRTKPPPALLARRSGVAFGQQACSGWLRDSFFHDTAQLYHGSCRLSQIPKCDANNVAESSHFRSTLDWNLRPSVERVMPGSDQTGCRPVFDNTPLGGGVLGTGVVCKLGKLGTAFSVDDHPAPASMRMSADAPAHSRPVVRTSAPSAAKEDPKLRYRAYCVLYQRPMPLL